MNDFDEIRLNLIMFSVGGVLFGVDAGLVAEITGFNDDEVEGSVWFHDALGYSCAPPDYLAPVIVSIRTEGSRQFNVIIDAMEDIVEISVTDIRPFPPLLEQVVRSKGLWGVVERCGRLVLLVDFHLMQLSEKYCVKLNGGNKTCY